MGFFWHVLFVIANWFPSILGFNLIFGRGKMLHFGPVGTSLVAFYATAIVLKATGSYLFAFLACLVATELISLFFAWFSLRLESDGLGIMTIAVHLFLLAVVLNWTTLTRGALGIPGIQRHPFLLSQPRMALTMVCVAVLWFFFMLWIDRGPLGRKLTALAEHPWHAEALGVNRARVQTAAFLVGGLGTSVVAFFWVQYLGLVHPNDLLFPVLILYVMNVVAGKPGSVAGVALSTTLLVLLKEGLRFVPLTPDMIGPLRLILFGLILFGAVWWRRDTVFPPERKI